MYIADNEKRGSELSATDQKTVLAAYVNRYTREHKPRWILQPRPDGSRYPVQFANDSDWLANTVFRVTKTGKLDRRVHDCRSYPTWPENPELRK